jgi:prephenate dehydrogenase
METVVIAGVGLIGGSFALALRKAGFTGEIIGVSSPPAIAEALSLGIIDEGRSLEQAVPLADLVFLAQPISRILETLERLDPLVREGCLVTDAGSTKSAIVAKARTCLQSAQFLGGHPMAGKEISGVAAADENLFVDRTWVLTPSSSEELNTGIACEFRAWLEKIGALPVVMDAAGHDSVVALTSHLPQLASTALASALSEALHLPEDARAAGPALLDSTRLALSSYGIWQDILSTNSENIAGALDIYIETLRKYREMFGSAEMKSEFERAAGLSRALRHAKKCT